MSPTPLPQTVMDPASAERRPENDDRLSLSAARAGSLARDCLAQHRQLQVEVARYIEILLGELATMAKAADLKTLVQSLDMSRREAGTQLERRL